MLNYLNYRGKCKEMSEQLVLNNPDLELIRGHYYCPIWNKEEQHWWCKNKKTGEIVDPTKLQFPSAGLGEYIEFSGIVCCAECGKEMKEEEAQFAGNYPVCSNTCYGSLVGVPLGPISKIMEQDYD